jgi:hypothetical protein
MSTLPPAPTFKPFNLALIQLGQINADKAANLKHARDMIRKAANGNTQGKPDLIVLPVSASRQRSAEYLTRVTLQECFNSPYGHVHFPVYAESIGYSNGEKYDVHASQSESVKMLSEAAKTEGVWLLGGPSLLCPLVPWILWCTYFCRLYSREGPVRWQGIQYFNRLLAPRYVWVIIISVDANIRSRRTRSHP